MYYAFYVMLSECSLYTQSNIVSKLVNEKFIWIIK